ncbi:glycosyltransferase family 4 protein [Halobacillus sp. A5]|uniref:glycosyltransferase family 4 protein n=1 Tax=Halobacillus sp. A5 TaxID=2880263 RepID=UPI0020A62675|nr:glycosyltransferase family 4 protein [Halobacillus sp. A5]MCP3029529.1 glycosyltransferase family 4 protein [Halobacillus sp. A5]
MSKPKILYLSDADLNKSGGAQQSMKVLMQGLRQDYEVYILTPNGQAFNEKHIVLENYDNFILRGKNAAKIIRMVIDIFKNIKKVNPDLIHVQMSATLIVINFLVRIGAISKKTKIVFTDRGVYGKYGKSTTKSINSIIKKSDKVITTTVVNQKNYAEKYPYYKEYKDKFTVIHNTAGEKYGYYDRDMQGLIRKINNIDQNKFVIGLCGRFSKQKNWPLAYEIIKYCKKMENVSFVIILGTDKTNDSHKRAKQYIEEVKQLVGEKNLKAFINLNNEEVDKLYYAMDCFLLSSKWESFGRTAVEAMARNNIVIGTNVDGLAEVIGDEKYTFNTAEEASKIIENLLVNRDEIISSKRYFYDRYHKKYEFQRNIEKHKELYSELLDFTNVR